MTAQTGSRAGVWGPDAKRAADDIREVQARENFDGDGYYGGPDEPGDRVDCQEDLDQRRLDEYERGLDRDGRWVA